VASPSAIDPLLLDVETILNDLVGHNSHLSFDIKKVLDIIREKGGTHQENPKISYST
jgi:hypothetical protein